MSHYSVFIVLLLATNTAFAGSSHFVANVFEYRPVPPVPAGLSWKLATADGAFVDFTIESISHQHFQRAYLVTPENAAQYGVDFDAWRAAVVNPAYTRNIVTFAGITQEQPYLNGYIPFELDRLQMFVSDFHPFNSAAYIQVGLLDSLPVPEPSSTVLILAFALLLIRPRWRRRVAQ